MKARICVNECTPVRARIRSMAKSAHHDSHDGGAALPISQLKHGTSEGLLTKTNLFGDTSPKFRTREVSEDQGHQRPHTTTKSKVQRLPRNPHIEAQPL